MEKLLTTSDYNSAVTTAGTHSITTGGGYNNTDKFTIVGTCSKSWTVARYYTDVLVRVFTLDLTSYDTLSFYAIKNVNHGNGACYILPGNATLSSTEYPYKSIAYWEINYGSFPTSWTEYTLDISTLSGTYKIAFLGGYVDYTGYSTSSTSYSNIRLIGPDKTYKLAINYGSTSLGSFSNNANSNIYYGTIKISDNFTGTKTLNCSSKLMSNNIYAGNKTLNCINKYMSSNISITSEEEGGTTTKLLTQADFTSGTAYNVTLNYLSGQIDNTDGFQITGRPTSMTWDSSKGYYPVSYHLRWRGQVDLTNYNTIKFYAKKIANHGIIDCKILPYNFSYPTYSSDLTAAIIASAGEGYSTASTTYKEYSIDVSAITGLKDIVFTGGYVDNSGYAESSTAYCDIRFIP